MYVVSVPYAQQPVQARPGGTMGQKLGRAMFVDAAKPFVNLSLPAMEALWEAFNDIADGFGVSLAEFKEIMAELMDELGLNRVKMDERSTALFSVFDSDRNGLVDGIEFITTLAGASGMKTQQALEFLFTCYDFDGTGKLTMDEVTLALKGTACGLSKLSGEKSPPEEELELLALEAFEMARRKDTEKLPIPDIMDFCTINPEIKSWIEYYADADEFDLMVHEVVESEVDYTGEAQFPARSMEFEAKAEGDNFLIVAPDAVQHMRKLPWVTTIDSLMPTEYANTQPKADAPDASLRLEWIHGYRGADVRNNVRYTVDGSAVYPAARVGVVYNGSLHRQKFMMEHTGDIVSLASHPDSQMVATGEAGAHPKILVWDTLSMKVHSVLRGFHQRAVIHLAFSRDGKKLASVGQDPSHCIAVYDWKEEKLLFTARSTKARVLFMVYGEEDQLVTCGIDHIFFWVKDGRGLFKKRGIFGHRGKLQAITCLASSGNRILSGTVSGSLYIWVGRNCAKAVRGHNGCVNSIYACKTAIVTGGKDMRIRLWSLGLEPGPTFNMTAFGANPIVRSVDMSMDGTRLLVGTKGCEIYEIAAADGSDIHGGPVTIGHFEDSLVGLATHPKKSEFATVGHDKTVRIWDVPTKTMIRMAVIDTPASCIDYSPDGNFLAVGLGAPGAPDPHRKAGSFIVLNEGDLTLVHEARDSIESILDVRYSPDGQTLALASADRTIYLYAPTEDYEIIARCRKHNAEVIHMDFSVRGDLLQSNCKGGQLLFLNTDKGTFNMDYKTIRDTEWATHTCTMAWPVQAMYPPVLDGTQMMSVDRSNTGEVLAAGDNFGLIRLFQYPCVVHGATFLEFAGHSQNVSRLKFLHDDSHLITVGAEDRCVFQWRLEEDDELDDADVIHESESEGYKMDMRDGSDLERSEAHEEGADEFGDAVSAELKPFDSSVNGVVPPWRESLVAPKDAPRSKPGTPAHNLELEWVYGYRGHDSCNNLKYSAEGRIIYPAGSLGVILHAESYTQRFAMEHSDEVICLAAHPSLKYMATGQMGRKPLIVVWEAETGDVVNVMRGFHRRTVSKLVFSPCGRYLVSVGQDADHSLAVYEWREGVIKAKTRGNKRKVLGLAMDPSGKVILQCGLKHVCFWEWDGSNLLYRKGIIGKQGVNQTFVSAAYVGEAPVVGTSDGHLYIFKDHHVVRTLQAHRGAIYALCPVDGGLFTGGKDGVIKRFDHDFELKNTFDKLSTSQEALNCRIRSLCLSPDGRRLLVGTGGNEIYELNATNGVDLHGGALISGTYKGQLWGMSVHPKKPEFASVGDDGVVRTWSIEQRRAIKKVRLDSPARAVAYSPTGKWLAVGLGRGKKGEKKDGGFVILDADKLTIVHEARDALEWVRVVRYSPDGKIFALAAADNKIYLYNVSDQYMRRGAIGTHRAPVTHLDFSADSQLLQSADMAKALVYTDMVTGLNISSAATVKDVIWESWTLPFGWPVQGLWPVRRPLDGSEILCLARSHSKQLVALGDSVGRLKLYNHPVVEDDAACRYYRGHGPEIRQVRWTREDRMVLTAGGQDLCMLQWRVGVDQAPDSGDEAMDGDDDNELIDVDGGLMVKAEQQKPDRPKLSPIDGPWRKALIPPSKVPVESDGPPKQRLVLEHVHGYRSEDVRNNVKYNLMNDVVWHAGATGVIYNPVLHRQEFFQGHRHDIISLAMTDDGKFVATGEAAAAPRVRIWDAAAGLEIATLPACHTRGIPCLAFSHDGQYLASVGQDRHHTVAIYRTFNGLWADAVRMALEKTIESKVLFCLFCGADRPLPLMLGGIKFVHFLYAEGKSIRVRKGIFGLHKKIQPVLCGTYVAWQDTAVTGTVSGDLYLWKDFRVVRVVHAHSGSVYAINQAELGVVTGGKDGCVKIWDREFACTKQIRMMDSDSRPFHAAVHSVCCNRSFTKVVVGMRGGEIYEIAITSGKRVLLTEGHSTKQLRGSAVNPTDPDQYCTVGDDGVLRVWSLLRRRVTRRLRLDGSSRAVAWSPDGKQIVVGFGGSGGDASVSAKDGAFMVIGVGKTTLDVEYEDRRAKLGITDVKFSRSGDLLVMASEDGRVYIHDCARNYAIQCTTQKASDAVQWIDLSAEGSTVHANTADGDLILYSTKDAARITTAQDHKDDVWNTVTCPYGWYTQGIFPREPIQGFEVTSVDRSHNHNLLAVALADGGVRLYEYPVQSSPQKASHEGRGHGRVVSRVRFTADDRYLVSLDGYGGSVFEFRVVEE